MKRVALAFGAAAAVCGAPGFALDLDPQSRAKAIAAATAPVAPPTFKSANPLVANLPVAPDALPDMPVGLDFNVRQPESSCAGRDLCYDYREKKLVYRPSRNWMPEIDGLTAEHMSLRRGIITFKYSFK